MNEGTESEVSSERLAIELSLAIGQLRRRLKTVVQPLNCNLSQMATLIRLEQNGEMTTSDLARAEAMKPQSMGAILADLQRGGLVDRRPDPADGRQVQYFLTDAGRETRQAYRLARRGWLLSAIASRSPDERARLVDAITLIRQLGEC